MINKQNANYKGKAHRPLLVLLGVLLLAACGEEKTTPRGAFDLRLRWEPGIVVEVREERVRRKGAGPFPTAAEITARTQSLERMVDFYREEVLATHKGKLLRTRRTYLTSTREKEGKVERGPLGGKTFEITAPLGSCLVEVVTESGRKLPAPEEEARQVLLSALRRAATLLPSRPVNREDIWRPARNPREFHRRWQTAVRMTARLASVEKNLATVESEVDINATVKNGPDIRITVRETMRLDLREARLSAYHGITEEQQGPLSGRGGTWRRMEATATFRYSTR